MSKVLTPNQIFRIKQCYISIILSILFLVTGYSMFCVFIGDMKSQVTYEGTKIYLPLSKYSLYVSISFFLLSLVTITVCFFYYWSIFQTTKSRSLYWLYTISFFAIIGIILNIIFMIKKYPLCANNQIYNTITQECIPICKKGTYLNPSLKKCVPGCKDTSNCNEGETCEYGKCTEMNQFVLSDNQTCASANEGFVCRSFDIVPTFCNDKGEDCKSICDSENVKCCNENGKTTVCVKQNNTCSEVSSPQMYPDRLGDRKFQPVFTTHQNINDCLKTNFLNKNTSDFHNDANQCFGQTDEPTQFICGLDKGNDVFLEQVKLSNCVDDSACLQYLDENTKILSVTTDDKNNKYCNFINQFNSTDKNIQNSDNCMDSPTNYTSNCNDFKACQTNPDTQNCPFTPDSGWNCTYNGKEGMYTEKGDDPDASFCVVQDRNYSCVKPATTDDRKYYEDNGYVKCNNIDDCKNLLDKTNEDEKNFILSYDCISGECSDTRHHHAPGCEGTYTTGCHTDPNTGATNCGAFWHGKNVPQLGITQMKYDNCGGGYAVGGKCDLKEYTKDLVDSGKFPCPAGTNPYFYASKNDTSTYLDCGGYHKGIYSRIDYSCCDKKVFPYDASKTQPSTNGGSYCLPQKSFKNQDGGTSVIIGRDGKVGNKNKDNPISSENSCDIHSGPSFTKLKKLLADANWEIWNKDPLNCSKAETGK